MAEAPPFPDALVTTCQDWAVEADDTGVSVSFGTEDGNVYELTFGRADAEDIGWALLRAARDKEI
jgi:hypothetical protein